MNNKLLEPPAEELTDTPAPARRPREAVRAAVAEAPRKSVLIINDDNDIHSEDDQSVLVFMSAFQNIGDEVRIEQSKDTSYSTWGNYDIVVWSCGDDYSAVNDVKNKQMLVDYIAQGGRLILEGGNIAGWAKEFGGETIPNRMFREKVLYATGDWVYHDVGDLKLKTEHPITTTPNALPETISFTPTDPGDYSGDANAIRILPDATGIYNWSHVAYGGKLVRDSIASISYGLIVYESKGDSGGRIVYFGFDIDDIDDPEIQQKLIQNSADWLKSAIKEKTGQKRAMPPRDNPFLRHEKLKLDREIGSEGEKLARSRLAALEHAHSMPTSEEGSKTSAAKKKGSRLTAPVTPGISNWVQMGPTSIAKGQTDEDTHVLVTGRVTSIIVDPTDTDIIYIGAAQGGVWKTTNAGENWVPKSDNEVSLSIGALAMDPTNHLVLYAGTGEGNFSLDSFEGSGVLKTIDGGDTWSLQGKNTFLGARFCRIAVNPTTPSTVFAATTYGIYRSINGGTNWTKMTSGLPTVLPPDPLASATDIVIDPTAPNTVYAAFWGGGIYKTTNANAVTPTWTKLTGGLPSSDFTRIALGISPSSPQTLYALMADGEANLIDKFYRTTDGGASWSSITLPGGNIYGEPAQAGTIGEQGFYNINVAVDPTTPDIVYLSGVLLWKAKLNSTTDEWDFTTIGHTIHTDNHAFAFDPTNHLVIYAGNDGGIYKSTDGGDTWSDTINKGPCITQFEFIDQHPTSDAVVFGGTQDNGTEQFRNSPVFYHAADGDGGFVAIDPDQPNIVIHEYAALSGASAERSTHGGKYGTGDPNLANWDDNISMGLVGESLFYPPFTLDQTNPNNIAFGTDRINLDPAQGTRRWPTKVRIPGLKGLISAINYINSNLIYVGTTQGEVYCLTKNGATWKLTAINAAPLPALWIWDVAARPDDPNTIIVVMAGFGAPHVWRGAVRTDGQATWTDISGTGSGQLPDIPTNALVIEPGAPDTMYIGTDIGVFRTTDGGTTWTQFSQGLPTVAVYDMRLHTPTRLLRAATHGRGMWERKLDATSMPDANIYMRNNLMDTGRVIPCPSNMTAAFEDPLQHIEFGDPLSWSQCADIKIDTQESSTRGYQMNVADIDYVAFESKLEHRNPQRDAINRVYVQVHNRGIQPATDVTVKILYAEASSGYPDLPSDFWTAFPDDPTNTSQWVPIGSAKIIPSLSPTEPAVLEWDWSTPATAADQSCLLVVTNCPSDPIPEENKVFNIDALVPSEKRVGLKKLDVI